MLSRFNLLVVKADGECIDAGRPDLGLVMLRPDLIDEIDVFFGRTDSSSAEAMFSIRDQVRARWRRLSDSAAEATVVYLGSGVRHSLLLLGGRDWSAEEAAAQDFEAVLASEHPGIGLADIFPEVKKAPRPLLVTFGNSGWGRGDYSINPTELVLAAVYFARLPCEPSHHLQRGHRP